MASALMVDCPDESRHEHQAIANALLANDDRDTILDMAEVNAYPETYRWLADRLGN
jgi:hypothetical protein